MKKYIAQIVQNDEFIAASDSPRVTRDDAMRDGIKVVNELNEEGVQVDTDDIFLVVV